MQSSMAQSGLRTKLVAMLAGAAFYCMSLPVHASEPLWAKSRFEYTANKTDLRELLHDFGLATGIGVVIEGIEGKVTGVFDLEPRAMLNFLAKTHHFIWYFDGILIHVIPSSSVPAEEQNDSHLASDTPTAPLVTPRAAIIEPEPVIKPSFASNKEAYKEPIVTANKPRQVAIAPVYEAKPVATQTASPPLKEESVTTGVSNLPSPPLWEIALADKTLNATLARWSALAGWQLLWELPIDYAVDVHTTIPGTFIEAVETVARNMEKAEVPMKVIFYRGNKVLRIVSKGVE